MIWVKYKKLPKWYYSALQLDKNNVYAANGIAVCLAELHLLTDAKLILEELRECANMPDVWVNLGNIFGERENYDGAIKSMKLL
eukprot:UN24225